jgi:DNA-binding transcriptional ArsR family regulator
MTTLTTAPLAYQRIAEAFVHPLKLRSLALMAEPPPPRALPEGPAGARVVAPRLCVAVGEPLGNVSYHVRELEKAGLIELVATKPRRGRSSTTTRSRDRRLRRADPRRPHHAVTSGKGDEARVA